MNRGLYLVFPLHPSFVLTTVLVAIFAAPALAQQEQLPLFLGEAFSLEQPVANVSGWHKYVEAFANEAGGHLSDLNERAIMSSGRRNGMVNQWTYLVKTSELEPTAEAFAGFVRGHDPQAKYVNEAELARMTEIVEIVGGIWFEGVPQNLERARYEVRLRRLRSFLVYEIERDASSRESAGGIKKLSVEKRKKLTELLHDEIDGGRLPMEVDAWVERLRESGLFSTTEIDAYEALAEKREAELFPEGRNRGWERNAKREHVATDAVSRARSRLLGLLDREAGRVLLEATTASQLKKFDRIVELRDRIAKEGTIPRLFEEDIVRSRLFSPEKAQELITEARQVMAEVFPDGRGPQYVRSYAWRLQELNENLRMEIDALGARQVLPRGSVGDAKGIRLEFDNLIKTGKIATPEELVERWRTKCVEVFGADTEVVGKFDLLSQRHREVLFRPVDLEGDLEARLKAVTAKETGKAAAGPESSLDALSRAMKEEVFASIEERLASPETEKDPTRRNALLELRKAVETGRIEPFRAGQMLGLETRIEIKGRPAVPRVKAKL